MSHTKRRRLRLFAGAAAACLAVAVGGELLATLFRDKLGLSPEEQEARRQMGEVFRQAGGDVMNLSPAQFRMMEEYKRTGRATAAMNDTAARAPSAGVTRLSPQVEERLRRHWAKRGVKWDEISVPEREMMIRYAREVDRLPGLGPPPARPGGKKTAKQAPARKAPGSPQRR